MSGIEAGAFSDGTVSLAFTQIDPATLKQVGLLYQTVLDRAADTAGLAWWAGQHFDPQQLAAGFTATAEFKAHYGRSTTTPSSRRCTTTPAWTRPRPAPVRSWETYLDTHSRAELIAAWSANEAVANAQFGAAGLWLA